MNNILGLSDFPDFIQKSFINNTPSLNEINSKIEENFKKGFISENLYCDAKDIVDFFEKGKRAHIGEIRTWGGKKYKKTTQGWKHYSEKSSFKTDIKISTEDRYFENGHWTKERVEKVHKPIINSYLSKARKSSNYPPVITLMMGAPATGKGWLISYLKKSGEFPETLTVIDPDEIKTRDLKSDFDAANNAGVDGSKAVHEEGSYLAKEIMKEFDKIGAEYIQDKVFHKYDRLIEEINRLKNKGLKVQVIMSSAPKTDSYKRMIERGKRTGRYVPEIFFNEAHNNIEKTFDKFIENIPDNVVRVRKYDTTKEVKLIKDIKK